MISPRSAASLSEGRIAYPADNRPVNLSYVADTVQAAGLTVLAPPQAVLARRDSPGNPDLLCVFVPNCPNPITGRLYFVSRGQCQFLKVPTREAMKCVVSGGNFIPEGIEPSAPPSCP